MTEPKLIEKIGAEESLARTRPPRRERFRIAVALPAPDRAPDAYASPVEGRAER